MPRTKPRGSRAKRRRMRTSYREQGVAKKQRQVAAISTEAVVEAIDDVGFDIVLREYGYTQKFFPASIAVYGPNVGLDIDPTRPQVYLDRGEWSGCADKDGTETVFNTSAELRVWLEAHSG